VSDFSEGGWVSMPGAWQGSSLLREGQTAQLPPSIQDVTQDASHNGRPFVSESLHSFLPDIASPYRYTASCWAGVEGCFANPLEI